MISRLAVLIHDGCAERVRRSDYARHLIAFDEYFSYPGWQEGELQPAGIQGGTMPAI